MTKKKTIIARLKFYTILSMIFTFSVVADEYSVGSSNTASEEIVQEEPQTPKGMAGDESPAELSNIIAPGEVVHSKGLAGDENSVESSNTVTEEIVQEEPQTPKGMAGDESPAELSNIAPGEVVHPKGLAGDENSVESSNTVTEEIVQEESQALRRIAGDENPVESSNAVSEEVVQEEPKAPKEKVADESPGILVYVVLLIMAVATLFSVSISFYLYRWRRILLAKPNALVPEEWGNYLNAVGKKLDSLEASAIKNMAIVSSEASENGNKIDSMIETYMLLHGSLNEKDSEIKRLKRGYDAEVFRKYLSRFIRIDQALDDYLLEGKGDLKVFEELKRLFEDAFDECGVESFTPQVGEDYRNVFGIAENPKKTKTLDSDKAFKIAEVLEPGYRLRNGDDFEIIAPSKVSIYWHEK